MMGCLISALLWRLSVTTVSRLKTSACSGSEMKRRASNYTSSTLLCLTSVCLQNWRKGGHHYGTHAWSLACRGEQYGVQYIWCVNVGMYKHLGVMLGCDMYTFHCASQVQCLCDGTGWWSLFQWLSLWFLVSSVQCVCVCVWTPSSLQSYNSAVLLQTPSLHCSVWGRRGPSGIGVA